MALKTLLYLVTMLSAVGGSLLISPVIGLVGYLLSYNLNPSGFWWGAQAPGILQRYSLIFSVACISGMVIHWSKLRFRSFFSPQMVLFWMYIFIIWSSGYIGLEYVVGDSNAAKMIKVGIIIFAASLLITDIKTYRVLIWIYILSALYSGFESYSSQNLSLVQGRLQSGVGGSDFSEGNFLAAHYIMILPWIGIYFLKGGWKAKIVTLVAAAFVVNTLIMIESRGAFLAIAVGVVTVVIIAGKKYRKKIILLMIIGLFGFIYLSDDSFWVRMDTIETTESSMDRSAVGRVEAWRAAIDMFNDYPFGVGEGNFKVLIGNYNPDAAGRDTHNTFFRCLAELGIQGIIVLMLLIFNAFHILRRIGRRIGPETPKTDEYRLHVLALRVSLIMYLVTTCFLTHTYIEEFYWLLMFPVFLETSLENEI